MISLLVCDVDGTLTNGTVVCGDDETETKAFSVRDGLMLKVLPTFGITVIFLTGRNSNIVKKRGRELGVSDILQGIDDKEAVLRSYIAQHEINIKNVAYVGDDLNDYAAMTLCGFKACPADAAAEIREICDYVSPLYGGYGAVRDICEHILKKNGMHDEFLKIFHVKGTTR